MGERNMNIVFSSSIDRIVEGNSSFDKGVLRVCYTGKNNNNSFISKDTFERCIGSIYNCPIVCRYDRETDTIGSHDMELVSNANGMRIVNVTHPIGIVPESASYWWSELEDSSGVHEYLCVDVLLWKRQEAYQKIKNDGITDESMEISVKDGSMVDGVYVINDFEFTAFCLLGTAKPCYESASLEVFSLDELKSQFAEMMREVKQFSLEQSSQGVVIQAENNMEGGNKVLEQKKALVVEYGFDIDTLGFSIEDMAIDELRNKLDEMKSGQEKGSRPGTEAFALEGPFREELDAALEAEEIDTPYGRTSHYWFWDYDRELSEVYAIDTMDFNIYGFSYSVDGDSVTIDFSSKKRMKVALVPFDEGGHQDPSAGTFALLADRVSGMRRTDDGELAEKYAAATKMIDSMRGEIGELRKYRADTEGAIAKEERGKVFARFEDLNGIEAFENLRQHSDDYSAEDLEEKCYAIRGRIGSVAKFSLEPKAPKLPIEPRSGLQTNEPYGGVFAEFGFSAAEPHNQ